MTVTLRTSTDTNATTKGSALTHAEMDANFAAMAQDASLSASTGAAKIGFAQSGSGAVAEDVSGFLKRVAVPATSYMTAAQRADVAAGTNTLDVAAAIQAAIDYVNGRGVPGVVYFPAGIYRCESALTLKNGVSLIGEDWGWTNIAGTAWNNGAVIYKAHTGTGISVATAQQVGNRIENLAVRSNKTTWATGDGINIAKAVECRLLRVSVFTVGGDGIVIGDNTVDTYHCYAEDCYVNNPGARCFVVATKWFRGKDIRSDGGTIGLELSTGAQEFNLHNVHFEGWSSSGIKSSGGRGDASGHNVLNVGGGGGTIGIDLQNVSGAFITNWRGFHISGFANAAGTRGVKLSGANNTHHKLLDSTIENAESGIEVIGDNCTVEGNLFSGCGGAFIMNASDFHFVRNRVESTVNSSVGTFTAGSNGRFIDNDVDKQLHSSGTIVDTTNYAHGNKGWVTKNNGQTASIATGSTIAHGLTDTPAAGNISLVCYTSGVTSQAQITAIDAANITISWAGTSPAQWGWAAGCVCDP